MQNKRRGNRLLANMKALKFYSEKRFSLVDPLVASVIAMVVLAGIATALFNGQGSNHVALRKTYATDAGDQFLRFTVTKIKKNLVWLNTCGNEKPGYEEPSKKEWSNDPLSVGKMVLHPDRFFDPAVDNNTGLFLLHEMSGGIKDFTAVIRCWKNVVTHDNGSSKVEIYAEVSYPYDVPYNSPDRKKEVFSTEIYIPTQISLAALPGPPGVPGPDSEGDDDDDTPPSDPDKYTIFGECIGADPTNINPGNSKNNQFTMVTIEPDCGVITRDCLLAEGSDYEYYGLVSELFIRPKSNGNSFMIYNEDSQGYYPVNQNTTYSITGEVMVYLYNDHADQPGDKDTAMGHWYICINGNAVVTKGGKDDSAPFTECGMKECETTFE